MATYRRFSQPAGTWFFTLVTERRARVLTRPAALHAMARAFLEVRSRYPFELLAWTALPDHVHVLVRLPERDSAYACRISIFKRLVSQRLVPHRLQVRASMSERRESGFWQRRSWEHLIRNEADLHRHLDYIHYNPVKHGLAPTAAAWPHSSFPHYVMEGVLPPDWAAPETGSGDSYGE